MTWPEVPLDAVAEIQGGIQKQPKRAPRDNAFPFLRVANVTASGLELDDVHEIELFDGELDRFRLQRGDLLVVEGNGSASQIGRAAVWDGSIKDAVHQNHLIRVRPARDLDERYLGLLWNSPTIRDELSSVASSTSGLHTLSVTKLKRIMLPLPPLAEQHLIVDLLEAHFSRLDAAENYLSSGRLRAEAWHQRLLANTLWSADYPRARIGDLLREPLRNGRSDRAATGGEAGTRSLTLTAVTKNAFTEANTKVTVTAPERARDLWLEPGDVFVQRSNTPALVGTTARYDGPREWAIFPDLLIRLRADEYKIDSRFLAVALQSKPGHDQLRRKAKGLAGSMPKIDQSAIAATTIPLPPVDVQQQLLAIIEDAADALALLQAEVLSALRRSRALRRALLEAAFSGRLTSAASERSPAKEMIDA
jgi:type I restriction enzyme S subunit